MARRQVEHIDFIKCGDHRALPCPWCGEWKDEDGISLDILFDYWYKVRCLNCSCMPYSSNSDTIDKAIEFWNTRRQLASVEDGKFLIKKAISDLSKVIS
jgi:hypothetical protein